MAPKVAGSSLVGHPHVFRIGKPKTRFEPTGVGEDQAPLLQYLRTKHPDADFTVTHTEYGAWGSDHFGIVADLSALASSG